MMDLEEKAKVLLTGAYIGNLGLVGLDGALRVIPVWFTWTGTEIRIASPPDNYKCRSLRADPRAVLTVSTSTAPYDVVTVGGQASVDRFPEEERIPFVREAAVRYLGEADGNRYVENWIKGGHPGPGDLIRIPGDNVRYSRI
jgi:hypothetical protein